MKRTGLLGCVMGGVLLVSAAAAFAEDVNDPKPGTYQHAVYEGLVQLKDGKFEDWLSRYCDKDELCPTPTAIASLKRYNLPAVQRIAPKCIRGTGLKVTSVQGADTEKGPLKVFIECDPAGMPRPFHLKKVGANWMFTKI
jgi:hypothetical protein